MKTISLSRLSFGAFQGLAASVMPENTLFARRGHAFKRMGEPGFVAFRRIKNPVNQVSGCLERCVYTHFGRVEQVGVFSRLQRRIRAAHIARIPPLEIVKNGLQGNRAARLQDVFMTALRPGGEIGRHEQLDGCIRTDHGSDITPVKHRAARASGKTTLCFDKSGTHRWKHGDAGGCLADRMR